MTYSDDDAIRKQGFERNPHFLFPQGDITVVRRGEKRYLDGWMLDGLVWRVSRREGG